ncbi:MAG: hypothetical protein DRP87_08625 [Spirochaetes bacterium]|nr:MAG: hypothetical protein DRP87_08625 [Spirochaetota bacterium]
MYVVVITDLKGNIELANKAFERTTGYNRKEALGKNTNMLKSGFQPPEVYSNLWRTID